MRLILSLLVAATLVQAAPRTHTKVWWVASVAGLVAANVLDAHSSWGRVEVNPMLRSRDGRFGGRAIAFKAGVTAGVVLIEALSMRRRPDLTSGCALVNFGAAGALGAAAAHNYRLPGGRR